MNFWSIFKRRKEIRTLDEQIKKPIFGSEEERRERFLIIMERLDKKKWNLMLLTRNLING
ncbi:MAG: hypothetical protein ACO2O4_03005 [Minisyncoccia bacterium]|jgi:hypothetical protein